MSEENYTSPEIYLLDIEDKSCLCASQGSPNINIGICDWEDESYEYHL